MYQSYKDFLNFNSQEWKYTCNLLQDFNSESFDDFCNVISQLQCNNWQEPIRSILTEYCPYQNEIVKHFNWVKEKILRLPELFPNGLEPYYNESIIKLDKNRCLGILGALFFSCSQRMHTFLDERESAKFQCMISYFNIMKSLSDDDLNNEFFIIEKKSLSPDNQSAWLKDDHILLDYEIYEELKIEDYNYKSIKADFANQYIGGGVLSFGCVQEEILFSIYPELLISMVFCKPMKPHEAIVLKGARRAANYSGYAWNFRFVEQCSQDIPKDQNGCIENTFVAMDALMSPSLLAQFSEDCLWRELNKAFISFNRNSFDCQEQLDPVVTGRWGCGEFGGFAPLKILLQWISASSAGRKIVVTTFKDRTLGELAEIMEKFRGTKCRELLEMIIKSPDCELLSILLGKKAFEERPPFVIPSGKDLLGRFGKKD
ncbi:hypothetical protein SteCoe_18976 [Stentor coeruleus]|uniref:PARG catalytic Macro domain-containing protein n=1 Tax=Stentor coeruleus TaxID=5963 RepID=A0A1R2BVD1_9CILI|nr:hypothetical protein SteCoe_18976 [Stentor coeruleus]